MAYVWTEDLATGNTMIDTQHKQLIKMVNDLLEACKSGQERTKLTTTMQFLVDYTVKHFADEEKLQQQSNYPDFANHKKLHEAFKVTVLDLNKQLKAEGATNALVAKLNTSIGGWLVTHIQREDKKVAAHIK
ncbi:MAG: bacteriohemerythrin [Lachnospiraceae bacterium]|jgi:hemerythrin|nr:bacteriohemerythrin [Lachnospiraceae bacterium]